MTWDELKHDVDNMLEDIGVDDSLEVRLLSSHDGDGEIRKISVETDFNGKPIAVCIEEGS